MDWITIQKILGYIQHTISCIGVFIIFYGILATLCKILAYLFTPKSMGRNFEINQIRLDLGQILLLGLEFIVAADLIGTTTAPDYYTVGILAIIVCIRTLLSYSLTREMNNIQSRANEV